MSVQAVAAPQRRPLDRRGRWLLLAALFVGVLVRLPGVYWGWNFPPGWGLHHPDEFTHLFYARALIAPSQPQDVVVQAYPRGLAAMTAVPIVLARAVRGQLSAPRPRARVIITTGRLLNVLFGGATVLAVFLLARHLSTDPRVALASAWWMALGGLHVTQSHFFVSDVPALLGMLVAQWLLLRDLDTMDAPEALGWAAFCLGVAFGLKLSVAVLPTLGLAALWRSPRLLRIGHCVVFFAAGFAGINLLMYTPLDLLNTLREGMNDPYVFSRLMGIVVYLVELPAIVGFPLLGFAVVGLALAFGLLRDQAHPRRRVLLLVLVLPVLVHAVLVTVKLDNFPRHLVTFIPGMALAAGLGLVRALDAVRTRGKHPAWLLAPVLAYQVAVVVDGERGFIREPRNEAYRWLAAHAPPGSAYYWSRHSGLQGYTTLRFPERGRPPILVLEMFDVNPFLSGVGFRERYPTDYRTVFDAGPSPARMEAFQGLFRGSSEYREVARFSEGYVMPEYRLADRLLGNRSRNYLTELVVFQRAVAE